MAFSYKNQNNTPIVNWENIYRELKGYPPWESGEEENILKTLIDEGFIKKGITLDTGCGLCTDLIYLESRGFEVTGIDISTSALEKAKLRKKIINLCVGNVLSLPFRNETFDFINDRGCFHHIEKKSRKIYSYEVARVLKKGGTFLIRFFSEGYYKSGGSGQPLYRKDIRNIFEQFFSFCEINDYAGRGNKWPVEMSWCLMKKKDEDDKFIFCDYMEKIK
ncbi:MAG: class I SAM-dependent methyltransferase [Candidatus Eremiobacterota bacterium]